MKLLLAEDEQELAQAVMTILQLKGYTVDVAHDGEAALTMAEAQPYDGLILDIMMPKMDGLAVLRQLRANGDGTPALMLTAMAATQDKVSGLEQGANDYLTKPFEAAELVARVQAMLRSQTQLLPPEIVTNCFRMDRARQTLEGAQGSVSLNPQEFLLLELFARHPGQALSATRLLEKVWNTEKDPAIVRMYIAYLNRKLSSVQAHAVITEQTKNLYRLEQTA